MGEIVVYFHNVLFALFYKVHNKIMYNYTYCTRALII